MRIAKTQFEHDLHGTKSQARPPVGSAIRAGRPKFPSHLSRAARVEYKRVCAMLEARAALTPGDYAMLSVYATVYSRWIAAKRELDTDGLMILTTILDSHGVPYQKKIKHPMLRIVTDCERQILTLASKLGLSPIDRDRVKPARDAVTREVKPGSLGAALLEMKVTR